MQNIFDYKDHKEYINFLIQSQRQKDTKLTYRMIAKKLGFSSSNFLILIIQGKRNISEKSITALNRYFKHSRSESLYFKNLVLFNQTTDLEKKLEYSKRLLTSTVSKKHHNLNAEMISYYANSLNIILRELVWLKDFEEDTTWIANKLVSNVNKTDIKKSIDTLLQLNLLKRDATGKLTATHDSVSTPDNIKIEMLRTFHIDMITRALKSFNEVDLSLRNISSVTVPIKLEQLPILEEKIADFRASVIKAISDTDKADEVYQLNIQLFPLTKS